MTAYTEDENWEEVLERAEEYDGSQTPEGLYIPAVDVVNVLYDVQDPRHQTLGYILDELVDGFGAEKSPEEGSVPREEVEDFVQRLEFSSHEDSPDYIIDELTSPHIESNYQFPYLEEDEEGLSFFEYFANGKERLGEEMSVLNDRVESDIVGYLEDKRFDEPFIAESQLKDDIIPMLGIGFLTNSALSLRNPQVRERNKRNNKQDRREMVFDIGLSRLQAKDIVAVDRKSDERAYRSQLNPVQRGLYDKLNPEDGEYEVLMTGKHESRIVPSNI
jgi:hypothetical protein